MREPYTSKVCGHSFSSDIVEHLKRQFGQVECPVTGCKSYVRMSDLYKDKKLARKITRELATQEEQTRNEHEDAAVVSDEED